MVVLSLLFIATAEGSDAEYVGIEFVDSEGNIYDGRLLDGSGVDFITEVIDTGITYRVLAGTDVPTSKPLFLRIISDIDSSFNMSMSVKGLSSWMAMTGLGCTLFYGEDSFSSEVVEQGRDVDFINGSGKQAEFDRDVLYELTFHTVNEAVLTAGTPPNPIKGIIISFTAVSMMEHHVIHFDANGGIVTESEKEVAAGHPVGELPKAYRPGFDFDGWYVDSERLTSSTIMGHTDITAKAEWVALRTVTFDANGGTVSEKSRVVREGYIIGLLPEPVRDGHSFSGWYTAPSGGQPVTKDDRVGSSDLVLYAHWSAEKDIDVHEETYVDVDGNTVYEKDIAIYYEDGSIVLDKYIRVTDPQERIISEMHRIESTGSDGSVELVYDLESTVYTESGRTVTIEHSESHPKGYAIDSTNVSIYNASGGLIFETFESRQYGIDDQGSDYSIEKSSTSTEDVLQTYACKCSGYLHSASFDYTVSIDWGDGTGTAVFSFDSDTIAAATAAEILSLIDGFIAPVKDSTTPVISLPSDTLTITFDALEPLAENGFSIRAVGEVGSVTIDSDCISQASHSGYDLILSIVEGTEENLNEKQLETIGDGFAVVVTMMYGDTPVHEIGGMAYITVEPNLDEGDVSLWYVDDEGLTERLEMTYDRETGTVAFETDHFSVYMVKVEKGLLDSIAWWIVIASLLVLTVVAFMLLIRRRRSSS